MNIVEKNIDEVKPYKNNPRVNDEAVDTVADSIKEFGFQQPIVVDKKMVIIVGHTRLKAAQKLGLKKVPVQVATNLTAKQTKQYRIMDNRTSDLSDWDDQKLKKEFDNLGNLDGGLDHIGFSQEDIDTLLADDLPDDLFTSDEQNTPQKNFLKFGDTSIEISDLELSKLNGAYDKFKSNSETSFVNWLLSGGD